MFKLPNLFLIVTVALATVTCAHMNSPRSGDHGFLRNQEGITKLWKKDKIPLTVFHDGGKYIKKECAWVNWAAGFKVVRCIEIDSNNAFDLESADIIIAVDKDSDEKDPSQVGSTGLYSDGFGNIIFAEIRIINKDYYVAAHEIFHALGLAHDERPDSIMNRYQLDPMEFPRLSEYDAMLLRKVYK